MRDPHQRSVQSQQAGDDTLATLQEIADLEAALAAEIARLQRTHGAPTTSAQAVCFAGRPMWWWRATLVSWANSSRARRTHARELLRGLSCALKDFDDARIQTYIENITGAVANSGVAEAS